MIDVFQPIGQATNFVKNGKANKFIENCNESRKKQKKSRQK